MGWGVMTKPWEAPLRCPVPHPSIPHPTPPLTRLWRMLGACLREVEHVVQGQQAQGAWRPSPGQGCCSGGQGKGS